MITVRKTRARPPRKPSESEKRPSAQSVTIAAPVRGWVENSTVVGGGPGMWVAENVFPTDIGVRLRGGKFKSATIGGPVLSMFEYTTATANKLFAATETAVYNVSTLDPTTVPTADITGQTAGYYSTTHFGTAGGRYLYAVNGADTARLYDGTSWQLVDSTSSPIKITGKDTSTFSYVWSHKKRIWFVEKGWLSAWYLPVNSLGGSATEFPLSGVMTKGGSLMFGATWSTDAGDGMDDRMVFVSDQGEVAVYEGTDPGSAADWGLSGVYQMAPPLGPNAHTRAGGDLLIATGEGLISLSAVVQKDPAALSLTAVSKPIEPTWRREFRDYLTTKPWEVVKWPRENMLAVSLPSDADAMLVANIQTGAWAKYTGWDVQCMSLFNGTLYFGSGDGYIYQAERGGTDDGTAYVCRFSMLPSDMGAVGAHKTVNAARATFKGSVPFTPQLSMSADYAIEFPAAPAAATDNLTGAALWDVGLWDSALWDDDGSPSEFQDRPVVTTGWVVLGKNGYMIAPQIQVTCGGSQRPDAEFLSLDVLFDTGLTVV